MLKRYTGSIKTEGTEERERERESAVCVHLLRARAKVSLVVVVVVVSVSPCLAAVPSDDAASIALIAPGPV
jgi:hypothetical protein